MIHSKETDRIIIGGKAFEHNEKGHNLRCTFVCAGLTYHTEHGPVRKKEERFKVTCGNCLFVCAGTMKERNQNYEILVNSGEVIEGPEFSFQVVRPHLKN
ncbi:MAG: hypothetical protein JRF40_00895 [Deltaproteobacteria bacterium]|nr:hypothetical protein [Deltaproteobacteria bacterium]MBW2218039.1 hypothetical protein [Deltaproteobacteria bacterium]